MVCRQRCAIYCNDNSGYSNNDDNDDDANDDGTLIHSVFIQFSHHRRCHHCYYYTMIIIITTTILKTLDISRSYMTPQSMQPYSYNGKISVRLCIHERHPIARPHGRAMGCLSWVIQRKMTHDISRLHCDDYSALTLAHSPRIWRCVIIRFLYGAPRVATSRFTLSIGRSIVGKGKHTGLSVHGLGWKTKKSHCISYRICAQLGSALFCCVYVIICWWIHDDVIKWKHFPRNWPFVRGIHRSPVNSPHKGQWRGALILSLICVWINDWVNNREAGDLRRYRAHYDVIVMLCDLFSHIVQDCLT